MRLGKLIALAVVSLVVLWLPFSIMCLVAIVVSLVAILQLDVTYAKDVLRAMDKVAAAVFGWGGRYTVSAECGSRRAGCVLCRGVCWLLNLIDPGHCPGAARREGVPQ